MNPRTRQIGDGERSGVLVPSNLTRFEAEWVQPSEAVRDVVDTYWAVRVRSGKSVTAEIGTSERSLQRALRSTVGIGTNEAARRMRLQEAVRRQYLRDVRRFLEELHQTGEPPRSATMRA